MEPDITPEVITQKLAEVFKTEGIRVSIDSFREILYVRIPGLNNFTENQVDEMTAPILDELESDFEEIILLDLPQK